jgi:glycosyltransferase involved in cell wall biosynthesis
MSNKAPSLSVVIPLFNEEEVLPALIARLQSAIANVPANVECVLIDDGSRDRTSEILKAIADSDSRFRALILSRNFGHQVALSSGLAEAIGDIVLVMDGDLQDPPELILQLYEKVRAGHDVVYAVRKNRKEGPIKRFCYWAFYRILKQMSPTPIALDSGDFCAMSRRFVDTLNSLPERHRFLRGMRSWIGFSQTEFPYDRAERAAGEPKYTFSKLMGLALDGIFSMSEKPLRIATITGGVVAAISLGAAAYILTWKIFNGADLPGYASLATGVFFLGGLQLLTIGILGEYVGRIHNEVKARPIYILKENLGRGLKSQAHTSQTRLPTAV